VASMPPQTAGVKARHGIQFKSLVLGHRVLPEGGQELFLHAAPPAQLTKPARRGQELLLHAAPNPAAVKRCSCAANAHYSARRREHSARAAKLLYEGMDKTRLAAVHARTRDT